MTATVQERRNRQTGTLVRIEPSDNVHGGWTCICTDHDQACDFDTSREARSFAASPIDWCSDCYIESIPTMSAAVRS